LENNRVYKELIEVKNFTYEKLIEGMYERMDRVDALLDHINEDTSQMTDQEKIKRVLELVYINLANIKLETFDEMVSSKEDSLKQFFKQLMGGVPSFISDDNEKNMEQLRQKFINSVIKYEKDPLKFFQVECEKFNYVATKMLKKIGKLYAMAKDDEPVNESIINWELHQKLMEKKYGKRPIHKKISYLK
jgi:truncated hemoglobin YjbI